MKKKTKRERKERNEHRRMLATSFVMSSLMTRCIGMHFLGDLWFFVMVYFTSLAHWNKNIRCQTYYSKTFAVPSSVNFFFNFFNLFVEYFLNTQSLQSMHALTTYRVKCILFLILYSIRLVLFIEILWKRRMWSNVNLIKVKTKSRKES